MITIIPVFLALLGWSLAARRITGCPPALSHLISASTLCLVLFAGGYIHQLEITRLVLVVGGACSLVWCLVDLFRKEQLKEFLLAPGVVCFWVFFVLVCVLMQGAKVSFDSDVNFGAYIMKEYLRNNSLPDKNFSSYYRSYNPGISLMNYFMFWRAEFSESRLFFGKVYLDFATLAVLFMGATWRRPWDVVGRVLVSFLLLRVLGQGFEILYPDQPLGLFLGAIVAAYFFCGRQLHPWLAMPLLFLSLIKLPGFLFAWFALGIVIADRAFMRSDSKLQSAGTLAVGAFVAVLAYAPHKLWSIYAHKYGAASYFMTTPIQVSKLLPSNWGDPELSAVKEVTPHLLYGSVSGLYPFSEARSLPVLGWVVVFALCILVARRKQIVQSEWLLLASTLGGLLAWIAAVYLIYLNPLLYSERFSSLRYTSSYVLGMIFIGAALVLYAAPRIRRQYLITLVPLLLIAICNPEFGVDSSIEAKKDGSLYRLERVRSFGLERVLGQYQDSNPEGTCYYLNFEPSLLGAAQYIITARPEREQIILGDAAGPADDMEQKLPDCKRIYAVCSKDESCEQQKGVAAKLLQANFEFTPGSNTRIYDREGDSNQWVCKNCQ